MERDGTGGIDVSDPDRGSVSLDPTHDREQTAR